jgi:hypothetical protein
MKQIQSDMKFNILIHRKIEMFQFFNVLFILLYEYFNYLRVLTMDFITGICWGF